MGQRTLKAPGVEIIEHDLSGYTTTNLGTGCLITGFAQKGEDLEPIQITNRSSWLLNFGAPTNEAEEYFYNAGMEVLNQQGFLYAAKIPYSNDIAGIYAASKFTIGRNQELYSQDADGNFIYDDKFDENGEPIVVGTEEDAPEDGSAVIEANSAVGRFIRNYKGLKSLGINTLQIIAPTGQDFISKDLVEEYETGESKPGSNVIYLVDKTRAVYTRATEIADKQENRDSRYCIGIVPVITTMCNTAYFQRKSTGLTADVPELYQPVRSLKTITFPAGAASAAEYQSTKFVDSDLHTPIMQKDNVFATSLAEQAATIAQSCLVNANLVDGKFKPFICNDVCVVVFKAFVSTEDGKIEFTPVEKWIGSLDPEGRDEKGRTTYIDSIINNNSEYIYCFSNLENPQMVLNPDHGFVAGSDSEYDTVKEQVEGSREFQAATLFSAYTAKMIGFGEENEVEGLAAPRDDYFFPEFEEKYDVSKVDTIKALRQFYNQDAKQRICVLDELVKGDKLDSTKLANLAPTDELVSYITGLGLSGYMTTGEKTITQMPSVDYCIARGTKDQKRDSRGALEITLEDNEGANIKKFTYEAYDYKMLIGKYQDASSSESTDQNKMKEYLEPKIDGYKLSELTILNSTDYLRAIFDFENLVVPEDLCSQCGLTYDPDDDEFFKSSDWAICRQKAMQSLIINSIENSARFKARLRNLKKAKINIDRLDDAFNAAINETDSSKQNIGKKYIDELFKSYDDIGLLGTIKFVDVEPTGDGASSPDGLLARKDALEAKLDAIVNIDTSKKEKMKPRQGKTDKEENAELEFAKKYLRLKIYLNSQYYQKLADMLGTVIKIIEDCAYAQQRYVESMRNIDDSNIMLGFYPEMAEPIITYTTIAQSLNKILDTMSDIHTSEIDVVCDAGISNIAQFVKQVYDPSADDGEDVGGLYEPVKYSSYFKFNKNTDLAYWKTIVYKFDTFCKFRGDCMFCTEGPRSMVLIGNKQVVRKTKKDTSVDLNILPYLSKIAGFNTSYGAGYLNWYRTISDYTGDTLWVPPSIKAMGTYILTDKQYNWWDAPAGMRRGVINMVETSFNPNRVQAGEIYDVNWNYAIHYLNDGIIQEGQKTFQTRQSALDRVNVRRLIGRIKRYVYFASRQFLYEPHTQAIREKYVKTITPFFQDLVNRGGLYDFKIICDSSNNTPEVIDRNELRVKIGIKPVKTIEFIIIDLCVLNTGASWTEMDSI